MSPISYAQYKNNLCQFISVLLLYRSQGIIRNVFKLKVHYNHVLHVVQILIVN